MLELTASAADRMRAALTESGKEEAYIRIIVTEDGAQLGIDEQREGDTAVKYEDDVLVVLDSMAADVLQDRKIDYDEEASKFVFA